MTRYTLKSTICITTLSFIGGCLAVGERTISRSLQEDSQNHITESRNFQDMPTMTKHRTAKEILASETQRNQPVQHREFLTANQWLKKTFPEIEEAGRQSISQGQYDALTKGYDNYFATQMAIANQSILQSSNGGSQGRGLGGLVIPPEVLERARAAMVRGDFADKNVTFVLRAYGIPPGIDDRAIKAEHRNENPFHTPK